MRKWKVLKIMVLVLIAISMSSTTLVADTRLWFRTKSETLPSTLKDMVKGDFKLDRAGKLNIYRKQGGCPYTDSSEFTLECWLYWTGEGGNKPIWRNPTAVKQANLTSSRKSADSLIHFVISFSKDFIVFSKDFIKSF